MTTRQAGAELAAVPGELRGAGARLADHGVRAVPGIGIGSGASAGVDGGADVGAGKRSRWSRWTERDLAWSLRLHRAMQHRVLQAVLIVVSRLGDGGFWYAMMAWLMYLGGPARDTAWQMFVAGCVNLSVYWVLKRTTARSRPYVVCSDIKACVRALDRGSFPSGHTMHAVCFATLAGMEFPLLGLTLAPFVALTALGRVALGVHYPSDVAAGAGIGLFSAVMVMLLM